MNKHVQDELPGIDWEQYALPELEYNEEDEEPAAVAEAFDRGDKGTTKAPANPPLPQTAFVVIIDADGDAEAYSTVDAWPDEVQRQASLGDMRRGCSEIITEINLQAGARFTIDGLTAASNDPKPADVVREALKRRRDL